MAKKKAKKTKEAPRKARRPGSPYQRHVFVTVKPGRDDDGEPICRVVPSEVKVHYKGKVTFKAEKGCGPLVLFVPTPRRARRIFPRMRIPLAGVSATRRGKTFRVTAGSGRQEYPYAVYCRGCNSFGEGSLPKMITGP